MPGGLKVKVRQSRHSAARHRIGLLLIALLTSGRGALAATGRPLGGAVVGGDLTVATDYIYRGISRNDGHPTAQFDLHASSTSGFFAGIWATTLRNPAARIGYEAQLYAGKRFDLSSDWSAALTAADYLYLRRAGYRSADYQEFSVSLAYLDTLVFSIAASPNTVRYWYHDWLGRYGAYNADLTVQWPLLRWLYATAGAGYYYVNGPQPKTGITGYAYGNAGLALEWKSWRLDMGYFFTSDQVRQLYRYAAANNHLAATLNWRF